MTRFLTSAAVAASMLAAAAAAPAAAQGYGQAYATQSYASQGYGNDFWQGAPSDTWQRISYLEQRIQAGQRDGSLSPQEARRAEMQLRQIRTEAMRTRRGGYMSAQNSAMLQSRLDNLSRSLRWARHNGNGAYGNNGYGQQGYAQGDMSRFNTSYDARRYYRDGPQYSERRLGDSDEVYRGSDGRYYCKRSDGTTGLIVGAAAGGILGNVIDGGRHRTGGTLVGGALGALLGRSVEQNSNTDIRCR